VESKKNKNKNKKKKSEISSLRGKASREKSEICQQRRDWLKTKKKRKMRDLILKVEGTKGKLENKSKRKEGTMGKSEILSLRWRDMLKPNKDIQRQSSSDSKLLTLQ
jgi:hypothetical protein